MYNYFDDAGHANSIAVAGHTTSIANAGHATSINADAGHATSINADAAQMLLQLLMLLLVTLL